MPGGSAGWSRDRSASSVIGVYGGAASLLLGRPAAALGRASDAQRRDPRSLQASAPHRAARDSPAERGLRPRRLRQARPAGGYAVDDLALQEIRSSVAMLDPVPSSAACGGAALAGPWSSPGSRPETRSGPPRAVGRPPLRSGARARSCSFGSTSRRRLCKSAAALPTIARHSNTMSAIIGRLRAREHH
jgi:hypothetical protein